MPRQTRITNPELLARIEADAERRRKRPTRWQKEINTLLEVFEAIHDEVGTEDVFIRRKQRREQNG